jgi:hypothetical protein
LMKDKEESVRITNAKSGQMPGGENESRRERRNRQDRFPSNLDQDEQDRRDQDRPDQPETRIKRRRHAGGMSCTVVSGDGKSELEANDPLAVFLGDILIQDWVKEHLPKARKKLTALVDKDENTTK